MANKTSIQKRVVVIVPMPNVMLLSIAGTIDVFYMASWILKETLKTDVTAYDVKVVSSDPSLKTITSRSGVALAAHDSYKSVKGKVDTLLIAGFSKVYQPTKEFLKWVGNSSGKVRRIGSVCTGAFVLAEAGVLKKHKATTHWQFCNELQAKFPDVKVDPDPIFIKDGNVYTAAGTSSGLDMALAMIEEDYGRELALHVARKLVVFLRRPGNQSQFSIVHSTQEVSHEQIRQLQEWVSDHLDEELSVELLAEKCSMSPRNFARVFLKETGTTPGKYLEKIRLEAARKKLEETHLSLDQIAARCGVGSADSLRRIFLRYLKITPSHYRNSFRTSLSR